MNAHFVDINAQSRVDPERVGTFGNVRVHLGTEPDAGRVPLSWRARFKEPAIAASQTIKIGIVTVSDRASRGEYEDRGGPAIVEYFQQVLTTHFEPVARVIADEQALIERTLIELADDEGCGLIVTTGGTGPAVRDVTPEATELACEKMMPGFGEQMRAVSLQYVPTAILSRQTAGVRGSSLIVNLPGKPKAIAECLDAIMGAVPYCLDLIGAARIECDDTRVKVFRPKT